MRAAVDRPISGISIPVSALRTAASCGTGELPDLAALGGWCRSVGLQLIQLLPVNDTGTNSSPYSALSAFALHPLYLGLDAVPGAAAFAKEIDAYRKGAVGGRLSYARTRELKLSIVKRIYERHAAEISRDADFARWREANPWVVAYAVFTGLKAQKNDAPWSDWGDMANPAPDQVRDWWEANRERCLPAAWTQYLLESQLTAASRALEAEGIMLKGDLPILMSRESVDVWSERTFFDLSGVAGAPPGMARTTW